MHLNLSITSKTPHTLARLAREQLGIHTNRSLTLGTAKEGKICVQLYRPLGSSVPSPMQEIMMLPSPRQWVVWGTLSCWFFTSSGSITCNKNMQSQTRARGLNAHLSFLYQLQLVRTNVQFKNKKLRSTKTFRC